jgi:uncharacterized membrane protein YebE (DUF533 family)
LNDPAQLLSLFLNGALGRSGRKRARKAARFVTGHRGLVTSSALLAAAGVAWGIYDSLKAGAVPGSATTGVVPVPPLPGQTTASTMPAEVLRIIRLAVSAARADGTLTAPERALILEQARKAGVEAAAAQEIDRPHPLADIVRGVTDDVARHDLYILAFTIVRADEEVTGGERIYLAQLAHQLGLDAATAARLESETTARIDAAGHA